MQTFLPYADFKLSARCLDRARLGKQRVECMQIARAIVGESGGWKNHPATKMWADHLPALCSYWRAIVDEWKSRGYIDNTHKELERIESEYCVDRLASNMPVWLGNEEFHTSHKSNLIRKKPEHYGMYFSIDDNLPYVWPVG